MSEEKKVEQDERGAFEAFWVRDVSDAYRNMALDNLAKSRSGDGVYGNAQAQAAWESWQARAASAANVAQGAEAIDQRFDALRATGHGLYGALRNIVNSDKAALTEIRSICGMAQDAGPIYQEQSPNGLWSDVSKDLYDSLVAGRIRGGTPRIVYAAPPAQTAITDEQREAIEWAAQQASSYAQPIGGETLMQKRARILRTLLTAAQSGDKS